MNVRLKKAVVIGLDIAGWIVFADKVPVYIFSQSLHLIIDESSKITQLPFRLEQIGVTYHPLAALLSSSESPSSHSITAHPTAVVLFHTNWVKCPVFSENPVGLSKS